MYRIDAKNVSKNFTHRRVLREVSFSLTTGESLAVIGRNGSGKTTLLRILAGLTRPSKGKINFSNADKKLDKNALRGLLSYVGPEMTLYDALSAEENLRFFATMRGEVLDNSRIDTILADVGLEGRGSDKYGAYSSGMKQRLKYAVALLNQPQFLLLDEPTANLDEDGKKIIADIIARQKESGIVVIATNERGEYAFAEKQYRLGD